ncbi:Cytochrome b2, mitochondrial precursor [Serendipita sp. 401]|nr:Cytochrome b2, mitochondrial precursor [Serendipita sp. 401]
MQLGYLNVARSFAVPARTRASGLNKLIWGYKAGLSPVSLVSNRLPHCRTFILLNESGEPKPRNGDKYSQPRSSIKRYVSLGFAFGMLIGLYEGFISSPLKLDTLPFSSSGQGGSKDGLQVLTLEEVQKHNSEESAWIIVGDKVYDVTDFLHMHPGGADIILRHAGKDVDEIFSSIHSPTVLKMLRPDQCVGMINVKELPSRQGDVEEQARIKRAREAIPPVAAMVNLYDFEEIAKKVLSNTAWAYYSSAAEDEASHANNLNSFKRYWFRPRVMRAGIMLTVDAPVLGKRERDIRNRPPVSDDETPGGKRGVSANLDSFFEINLQWADVAWLKGITSLPIVIKGIQTVEDVELAIEHGADAVYLSCHGGRQLDYAPAAMDVLWELRQRRPECFAKAEIYIDGGVRRGSDVVKALALGAKAVGLGRPFLYANGTYGERGVKRAIEILEEEIATTMRLVGARSLSELVPDMVQRDDVAFVALRDRQ